MTDEYRTSHGLDAIMQYQQKKTIYMRYITFLVFLFHFIIVAHKNVDFYA